MVFPLRPRDQAAWSFLLVGCAAMWLDVPCQQVGPTGAGMVSVLAFKIMLMLICRAHWKAICRPSSWHLTRNPNAEFEVSALRPAVGYIFAADQINNGLRTLLASERKPFQVVRIMERPRIFLAC